MFTKFLATAFLLTIGTSLMGCAAETGDEIADGETDAFAVTEDSSEAGDDLEIARTAETSRACSSSELASAQVHANENHSVIAFPGVTLNPRVTSCTVSNGWIVYTYGP